MEPITFLEVKQERQQKSILIMALKPYTELHTILSKTQTVTLAYIVHEKCKVWNKWHFAHFPKLERDDTD